MAGIREMAWVSVRWIEDTVSLPSTWVVEPTSIQDLPVKGICYWKRRASQYEAEILAKSGKLLLVYLSGVEDLCTYSTL